ncbi:MAG: hypothetical protein QOH89_3719 [Pseudonocardiales bacterium]|jgi:hypothetical protein|nr:hypothetical protein [Pseudonocardiales bacterium]
MTTKDSVQMRQYGPGNPLVFSHIPKTAGTSLRVALEEALKPAVFVQGVDTSLLAGYDDLDAISPAERAVLYLSPDELPADATLVAGHIGPATTMARYPGADHITVLRAPELRILSQWLHGRALTEFNLRHWGPNAEAFRIAWRPLREFLDHAMLAPNVDNTIARFLAWPHAALSRTEFIDESDDDDVFAAALERLDTFGYVNVVENPAFQEELGSWLGRELPPTRANERTAVPKRRRPDMAVELDAATRELLAHRTRIDTRVWKAVAARVLPGADPDDVLAGALQKTIARYQDMLAQPAEPLTLRTAVGRAYEVAIKLRRGGR